MGGGDSENGGTGAAPGRQPDAGDVGPSARRAVRRPRGRRVLVGALAVLVTLGVATAALSIRWFVRPTVDGPVEADAVVMFGGSGDRFERAVALMEAEYADVIVISDAYDVEEQDYAYEWFCRNDGSKKRYPVHDYEAICFHSSPMTTRGEARYVADLARERGWERINLVTTVDQATRARMLVSRCWDGDVASVVVPSDDPRPLRIAYEWAAMARATVQRRSC